MKHKGKARQAGIKLIVGTLVVLLVVLGIGWIASLPGSVMTALSSTLVGLWILFVIFSINFFRDPDPQVPARKEIVISPAHGKVDVIDETEENQYMGGKCKRVSIFLSVFDVHVQNSPVNGKIAYLKHCPGKFMNAMRADCATYNENVLIGLESAERLGEKIAVRLIAGLLARRIVPWVNVNDVLEKGDRISLIQFGSRVDLFLPLSAKIEVKLGDRVKGGITVIATSS